MKATSLTPQFVEGIPESLEFGVLYVSMTYATAIHQCACGCGREVVTPFSPTDWKLYFDGENVTLKPSIGNWSFPCRSHYWIRGGEVRWAGSMSQHSIDEGRTYDRQQKAAYYGSSEVFEHDPFSEQTSISAVANSAQQKPSVQVRMRSWWKRWTT